MSSTKFQSVDPKVDLSPKEEVEFCRDDREWDDFVFKHPNGSVYHLSAWKTVLERSFPHIKGHLIVIRDSSSKNIVGAVPIYLVRSWVLGNRVVSAPFASFCDPLLSMEQYRLVQHALRQLTLRERTSFHEFRPLKAASVLPKPSKLFTFKHHYLPLAQEAEAILANCSKSCVRKKVKRALSQSVIITQESGEEAVRYLHAILEVNRRNLALPALPITFFRSMCQEFKPSEQRLSLARRGGEIIGALFSLRFRDWEMLEYIGSLDQARNLGVNQLLYWEHILASKKDGHQFVSFGRTSPENIGLLEYKRHWGATEEDQPIYIYSSNGRSGSEYRSGSLVYTLARALFRRLPRPIYSLAGQIIYRHLG